MESYIRGEGEGKMHSDIDNRGRIQRGKMKGRKGEDIATNRCRGGGE